MNKRSGIILRYVKSVTNPVQRLLFRTDNTFLHQKQEPYISAAPNKSNNNHFTY